MTSTPAKRGRPARRYLCSTGEHKTLGELGITRARLSRAQALARVPEDVFEAELARAKPSVSRLAMIGRGHDPEHRYGADLTEAIRLALRLSDDERRTLVSIIADDDA